VYNQVVLNKELVLKIIQKKVSLNEAITAITLLDPELVLKETQRNKIQEFLVGNKVCDKFRKESKFDSYQMDPRQMSATMLKAMMDL